MRRLLPALCAAWVAWSGGAHADEKLRFGPPAAWVKPADLPAPDSAQAQSAVQVLLGDAQTRFGPASADYYVEQAVLIQTPQGLAALGALSLLWKPDTDAVTVHKAQVIRAGQVVDLLANGQTFTILRREQNLEASMLDGQLTATLQPEGLQVGDVVDLAYTLTRVDPVMEGHAEHLASLASPTPIRRLRFRALWPKSRPLKWRKTDGLASAKVSTLGSETELVMEMTNAVAPEPPRLAPARFSELGQLELSDYSDWGQVSAFLAPHYARAAVLMEGSPLRTEIDKIKAASRDPKVRAAAALRLAQDQVRYVYQGMDNAGYVPATADATWSRRFGDCKGKTALLLALLAGVGVEAEPALVSVSHGDGLEARLPMLAIFDHVLVRAVVDGRVYWLDGTRQGDADLDLLRVPLYRWALPVRRTGARLEPLTVRPLEQPDSAIRLRVDASAGLFAPAPVQADMLLRGDQATAVNLSLSGASRADVDKALKAYWSEQLDGYDVKTVAFAFEPRTGEARLSMTGAATLAWTPNGQGAAFHYPMLGRLGWNLDLKREPGPRADAPFAVEHPTFEEVEQVIVLPRGGEGFSTDAADVDKTLAAIAFRRTVRLDKGVFTVRASSRSLRSEFPASEAAASKAGLAALADATVFIRAPAAYDPTKQDIAALRESTPGTAEEFLRRGIAFAQGGEAERAMKDFDEAIRLEPTLAWAYVVRSRAHLEAFKMDAALADANKAVGLNPTDPHALLARGSVHLNRRDGQAALQAFDEAAKLLPRDAAVLAARASALALNREYDQALQAAAQALELDPEQPEAYFTRADVFRAKGDREAAVRELDRVRALHPRDRDLLNRRGQALLGMARKAEAFESFTQSLALGPTLDGYLGRAQARKEGERAQQLQDIALAEELDPTAAEPALVRAKVLISDGKFDQAVQTLGTALKRGADEMTSLQLRAQALAGAGQYGRAIADRDRINSLDPNNPRLLNESCWTKATGGRAYEAALSDCNRALELSPGSAATLDSRGFALLGLNRLEEAIKDFDAALAVQPDQAASFYARGVAKRRKGDVAGGDADLLRARSLRPEIDAQYKEFGLTP